MSQPESAARVLAVIPARGGSKGVPGKNLARVGGVPLVARAVRQCLAARLVTDVVVSTDDDTIASVAREAGAEVVRRPAEIAGDTASSEAAVLHALDSHEEHCGATMAAVLLVQCTSPFLTGEDIDGVTRAVLAEGADSALTVAPFHGFIWRDEADEAEAAAVAETPAAAKTPAVAEATAVAKAAATGAAAGTATGAAPTKVAPAVEAGPAQGYGVNHDKSYRPRRQDRPQDLLETGAAYAMRTPGFREHRHRFFGRTAPVRTDAARVLEVDEPDDLTRARALAPLLDVPGPGSLPTRRDVDAIVLDFDGTQTDDRVYIDAEGRELVAVHRGDGLGIAALRRAELKLLILSSEKNPVVAARARKLHLPVLHGVDRKDIALKQWCEEEGIAPERVLYVGNDVNDLPCFGLVGWPVAVAGAHAIVRDAARAVTSTPGGDGAIREIASWILGPSL
ncbi:acylneuraminate cytidylyltransferase [Streptomyces sp. NBC_01808]|uniref:acylneuraminate cytidylyltransferase n=1 Tax=Streptomyces sp. NBC_01808 TaxID=2975947 RepID=UPI002DD8CC46|nr:acylneuraminate cytidylyltransferase [Streptomyces sp. NBC_01808]WSA40032.1 acylneuraminate cytidylyltransferase [Streptomyces sp. NBC_01808]